MRGSLSFSLSDSWAEFLVRQSFISWCWHCFINRKLDNYVWLSSKTQFSPLKSSEESCPKAHKHPRNLKLPLKEKTKANKKKKTRISSAGFISWPGLQGPCEQYIFFLGIPLSLLLGAVSANKADWKLKEGHYTALKIESSVAGQELKLQFFFPSVCTKFGLWFLWMAWKAAGWVLVSSPLFLSHF